MRGDGLVVGWVCGRLWGGVEGGLEMVMWEKGKVVLEGLLWLSRCAYLGWGGVVAGVGRSCCSSVGVVGLGGLWCVGCGVRDGEGTGGRGWQVCWFVSSQVGFWCGSGVGGWCVWGLFCWGCRVVWGGCVVGLCCGWGSGGGGRLGGL